MRDYETLWHIMRNSVAILIHRGNTPITPLVLEMMMENWEKTDDLKQVNRDLQENVNELDAQLRLKGE